MRKTDNFTTIMCRLCWNLGASTFWNPQGLSRPEIGLLVHDNTKCWYWTPSLSDQISALYSRFSSLSIIVIFGFGGSLSPVCKFLHCHLFPNALLGTAICENEKPSSHNNNISKVQLGKFSLNQIKRYKINMQKYRQKDVSQTAVLPATHPHLQIV
jgi:hypothetical protein